ncbi:MAG: enoyl-CoA hydratase/isomerase family protein [Bacteroidota bacterium]
MTTPENIVFEMHGCIAVLKISNPPQNFLKAPAFISKEYLKFISDQDDVKGIVISGVGRHFSAGANIDNLFKLTRDTKLLISEMSAGSELLECISILNIPVVAAINGVCWGGGLEIALACHIRFASVKALFAFPEVNTNLIPGLGGIFRLAHKTGTAEALVLILSGETFNASTALKFNVVDALIEENVLDYTIRYITNLVNLKPKKVINSIMQALVNAKKLDLHVALHEETRLFCELALDEAAKRKSELK